jgi:hypothetical protein
MGAFDEAAPRATSTRSRLRHSSIRNFITQSSLIRRCVVAFS